MKKTAKHILLGAFAVCICGLAHANAAEKELENIAPENFHVYLLIGGAEMAGRCRLGEEDSEVIDRCYLLNDDGEWEPARGAMNRYSTIRNKDAVQGLGPARGFVKAMLEVDKDVSIGLVVNAGEGAQNFVEHWRFKDRCYREMRMRARLACKSGTFKGVLWYQDGTRGDFPLSYLKDLIGNLRVEFRLLNLPFIVGKVPGDGGSAKAHNSMYEALANNVHAIGVASAEGVSSNGGHLDAQGAELLGRRYAEEMLKVQRKWADKENLSPSPKVKLIDAHVHAFNNKPGGLDIVAKWMERNNVARCISKPLTPTRAKTKEEREIMLANFRKYRGKIYRFCLIEPDEVSTVEEAVAILKKEKAEGAIGFGEHYGRGRMFDDPTNLRLYAACEQVGLPIHFHIDRDKNMDERDLPHLEWVLKMFPKCNFIAHAEFWCQLPDGTCDRLLQTYPNLYAEPSGLRMAALLNRDRTYTRKFLIRNADKILFGTDAGWWSFGKGKDDRELQFTLFEQMDLPEDVKTKIYSGNAEKLFGFEDER